MKPNIITIGVYGFEEADFFQALRDTRVDTFCDLRARRGMRGSRYAFVNSTRLQERLRDMGIRYLHLRELAPSTETRAQQHREDRAIGVTKRNRTALAEDFVRAYEEESLSSFDSASFIERLGPEAQVVALFCVEHDPKACHRSLVAQRLARDLGLNVEHLIP